MILLIKLACRNITTAHVKLTKKSCHRSLLCHCSWWKCYISDHTPRICKCLATKPNKSLKSSPKKWTRASAHLWEAIFRPCTSFSISLLYFWQLESIEQPHEKPPSMEYRVCSRDVLEERILKTTNLFPIPGQLCSLYGLSCMVSYSITHYQQIPIFILPMKLLKEILRGCRISAKRLVLKCSCHTAHCSPKRLCLTKSLEDNFTGHFK